MPEKQARLRRGELIAPEKNPFATTETRTISIGDENGNIERKIAGGHNATTASLDEHFPHASRIGISDEQERYVNGAGQLENDGARHSGDAP
ncbi:MAG: hypothetical protein WC750_00175 [Patescibacteria group bacterium]|jgi:hypothetical protein